MTGGEVYTPPERAISIFRIVRPEFGRVDLEYSLDAIQRLERRSPTALILFVRLHYQLLQHVHKRSRSAAGGIEGSRAVWRAGVTGLQVEEGQDVIDDPMQSLAGRINGVKNGNEIANLLKRVDIGLARWLSLGKVEHC